MNVHRDNSYKQINVAGLAGPSDKKHKKKEEEKKKEKNNNKEERGKIDLKKERRKN